MGTLIEEWGSALFVCCVLHIIHVCKDTGNQTASLFISLTSRIKKMVKNEPELANRPDNTAFTQQRLPAWQPMLSAGIIIPGFVVIGVAFIGIGVALFVTSRNIDVLEVWPRPPVTQRSPLPVRRVKGVVIQNPQKTRETNGRQDIHWCWVSET